MKAGRLIEALRQVPSDTEVMCGVTIEDTPTLFTINVFDLERVGKYEVKSVLTKPNDDKYCTLLIKKPKKCEKDSYQYNPKGGEKQMRFETVAQYDEEIKRYDRVIDGYKKYYEEHPEDIRGHTNHEVLKYIRDELKKERDKLKKRREQT